MTQIRLYLEGGTVNGAAIRAIRQVLDLTTIELATRLEVTQATLIRWEQGQMSLTKNRDRILPALERLATQAEQRLAELQASRPSDYERYVAGLPDDVLEGKTTRV